MDNEIKNYTWGHPKTIYEITNRPSEGKPGAELWMGAHPVGSSRITYNGKQLTLNEAIKQHPKEFVGPNFTSLPFMMKLLAVNKGLSIQIHPDSVQAKIGFDSEVNVPVDQRSFCDTVAKAEAIIPTTQFQMLAGFRKPCDILADVVMLDIPQLTSKLSQLLKDLNSDGKYNFQGFKILVSYVFELLPEKDVIIQQLLTKIEKKSELRWNCLRKAAADYQNDIGLLFFLVLECFDLQPGQIMYFRPGLLHAYLQGTAVEVVCNSDTTLRCGLTPKKIDQDALLKALKPDVDFTLFDQKQQSKHFETTILKGDQEFCGEVPHIVFCYEGHCTISAGSEKQVIEKGQSCYIMPGSNVQISAQYAFVASAVKSGKSYFIGVDGGGTSTRACLIDENKKVLGIGKGGPSSIDTVTSEITAQSIYCAVSGALKEANLQDISICSAVAGLGGVVSAADRLLVKDILCKIPCAAKNIATEGLNDMIVALAGGTSCKPGIVIIMGTGAVVFGRNAKGEQHKSGGWGWKEGDPSSSYAVGLKAIQQLTRAGDGRQEFTPFTKDLFNSLGLNHINDITTCLYQNDMNRTEIADLAKIVTRHAEASEPDAFLIIKETVADMKDFVNAVYKKLFVEHSGTVPIALVGSLGNSSQLMKDMLQAAFSEISKDLVLQQPEIEPVLGAAYLAFDLAKD